MGEHVTGKRASRCTWTPGTSPDYRPPTRLVPSTLFRSRGGGEASTPLSHRRVSSRATCMRACMRVYACLPSRKPPTRLDDAPPRVSALQAEPSGRVRVREFAVTRTKTEREIDRDREGERRYGAVATHPRHRDCFPGSRLRCRLDSRRRPM